MMCRILMIFGTNILSIVLFLFLFLFYLFIENDVQQIIHIPRFSPFSSDSITWNADNKGLFFVRSAYHLAIDLKESNETSP